MYWKMELPHSPLIFIILIIIPILISKSNGDPRSQVIMLHCGDTLAYNQTTYISNFFRIMAIIGTQVLISNNVTAAVGIPGPDQIYGLFQCYNDISSQDCILCFGGVRTIFPKCFPHTRAWIYLDGCFMRVADYNFYNEYTSPNDTIACGNTTRNDILFQESTRRVVADSVTYALRNNEYFVRKEESVSRSNKSVYVMAECWKTLKESSCRACLENASLSILKCLPWSEGRVLNIGCFMRYADTNFLNPLPDAKSSNSKGKMIAIVASVCSSLIIFIVALLIILYIRKQTYIQQKRKGSFDAKKLAKILIDSSLNFKYSTLEKATDHWDESNKIGQGGFGTVYKGILRDGREIAVKRLFFNNKFRAADFYNEINIISSIEHKNLLRLLGCSCSGQESILVYEYLPNMSLDLFIFDEIKGRQLAWVKRFEIIIGIAEGLVYLHENNRCKIIHRDIKASNILLDLRLRAKIADFGLARSFQDDKSHISTAIAGTLGYMAPEYLAYGQLTEKTDVYSFGVLLLEVVTGIENNKSKTTEHTASLVAMVWKHFNQGIVEEIIDPNLMMHVYPNTNFLVDVIKVVHIGLLCTQEVPYLRPYMSKVLKMLLKDDELLPAPSNPPFIDEKTMELDIVKKKLPNYWDSDDSCSVATVSHSDFFPR